ncbi:hypothetical protein JOC94_002310 [Bacillus thermophilus]|uniref:Uncharacterized protein n=1 Tax=Siminovitchia thermophila TaxID=1245522 RepID=A0ABS2R6P5_9BACI|nr:hypothetical protein [Siminovitchia thermophila]MBM7715323.1 hypothetical protein [Siminovitchia thermophila]
MAKRKRPRNRKNQKELQETADYIIARLKKKGIVIQRYDSYSTNSIYLKLDYGVSNSVRISDHKGKKTPVLSLQHPDVLPVSGIIKRS